MTRDKQKPQTYVLSLCDQVLGLPGLREHRFDWLLGDVSPRSGRATKLPVDSYWPALGLVVEVHERQHYEAVKIMDQRETISGVKRGVQRRIYDQRRVELLPRHGIALEIIRPSQLSIGPRGTRHPDLEHDRSVVEQILALYRATSR